MQADSESLLFDAAWLPAGWARDVRLILADGRIAAIEPDAVPRPGEERHGWVLPGLPNLHSHAFQRAMAGLAERRGPGADSFWTWREAMYRFVGQITPDDLLAIAAQAQVEMLESGFTRVGEFHYLHHDAAGRPFADPAQMGAAVVAAAQETGIGLTLLPVLYAHSGFGGQAPGAGQARFINDVDQFARLLDATRRHAAALPDAVVGVAPHSLRAVAPAQLAQVPALAHGAPIHIHIAEQVKEVEDCLAWSGQRPVEWLLDHAAVDAQWCLVHATHMTPAETLALASSGAVAGLCPITEANLGDGLFPAGVFLAAGGRIGVGSDSNVRIDAAEELRVLEYGQRLAHRGRAVLASGPGASTGETLLGASLAGGVQALGQAASSALAVGQVADLVSLDPAHPALAGHGPASAIDAWIFAGGTAAIDGVWRGGRHVVREGRHHARDAIAARYRATIADLMAR
ncbi:formimidoylglutamate deiminase [Novosphingobium sp. SG720]|uniref:formimidoylglutamate deiminase n=1 Tax=Novosphingobium sp. SG720 TaxID=2586998 RepID=UPI001447ECC1|nr:formimidoylglutamate deiminase [Novosphingobium sp. SG720]NKJ43932.1 formiminoglutamate deiminase [Novosphingobium sp. SG720]